MTKTTAPTMTKTGYTIQPLAKQHMLSAAELFTKSFCDSEPITKHLGVQYHEYEPFVMDVIQKAVKDGLSVVAVDKNNSVVACAIAEDITDIFKPNIANYTKLKPVFALLETLSQPFLQGKKFKSGKIAHVWIAIVDQQHRGKSLSTEIDMACGVLCANNGYEFAYAEFTNPVSQKIAEHYQVNELCNTIPYDSFKWAGTYPFKGVTGAATAYIVAIRPEITLADLDNCYSDD